MSAQRQVDQRPGVIAVLSARPGCGATTFATNLALTLHDSERVCLLDLDLARGDVAQTLHLQPDRTIVTAGDGLEAVTTRYLPALDCVLAPARPGEAARVPVERIGALIEDLAAAYDRVVVDTPGDLSLVVLAAIDMAEHHVLVTSPERPALIELRGTLNVLDLLGYASRPRSVVVNRADVNAGLAREEIEELLHTGVTGFVPLDRDVPASRNRGTPLALSDPAHPVSAAIRSFAESRLGAAALVERGGRHVKH